MKRNNHPPKNFLRFFQWFCHPKLRGSIEGDLMELYRERVKEKGKFRSDLEFIADVLLLFRRGIIKPTEGYKNLNSYGMIKSYFTIGWRNLFRNKSYTFINISGLALGMTVAILLGLWVFDELNFNKSFKNHDRIGNVYHHLKFGEDILTISDVPHPLGNVLKTNFAEFDQVVMASWPKDHTIDNEKIKLSKSGLFVEPQFIEMFSVHLTEGATNALSNVHSILLSKTLAHAVFGGNAVGKMIKFDGRDQLMVRGVFDDFPSNSQFAEVKMLLPFDYYFTISEASRKQMNSWEDYSFQCFVLLNASATFQQVESKIKNVLYQKISEDGKALKPEGILLPMEKWHLYSEFKNGKNVGGQIRFVWMFGIVGAFVLFLACINFMNLSTARSERRSKEVGIRKVLGSLRNQLVNQFLSESLLVVLIAFLIALGLVVLCLPWFNELAGKQMEFPWGDSYFFLISLAFILITSVLAGSYPALYLSSFNPVKALKGAFKAGRFASVPRKVMVAFQFTISTTLIIGTLIVFQQIQHAKDRPVGFDREGIIHIGISTEDLAKANYNSLRNEFLSIGAVDNMAKSDFPITGGASADASLTWQGKDPAFRPLVAINSCSHDFPKTNGFQFVEGRDFSRELSTDSSALIVNEMFAKLLSDKSVIGKKISFGNGKEKEIIGVIKNQVRWSPFMKQSPHLYYLKYSGTGYLTVRLKSGVGVQLALDKIEAVIKKYDPEAPFDYKFLDEDYARLFKDEERIGKLATVFAALAIFISCIGMFGLASFAAGQRTKEIGIRKVLGATVFNVCRMLSQDFALLVVAAVIIAEPIAYYFSNQWLQQYDYRIQISGWIFALTGMGALLVTLLTVSYQSIKAAIANPVTSLRSE